MRGLTLSAVLAEEVNCSSPLQHLVHGNKGAFARFDLSDVPEDYDQGLSDEMLRQAVDAAGEQGDYTLFSRKFLSVRVSIMSGCFMRGAVHYLSLAHHMGLDEKVVNRFWELVEKENVIGRALFTQKTHHRRISVFHLWLVVATELFGIKGLREFIRELDNYEMCYQQACKAPRGVKRSDVDCEASLGALVASMNTYRECNSLSEPQIWLTLYGGGDYCRRSGSVAYMGYETEEDD